MNRRHATALVFGAADIVTLLAMFNVVAVLRGVIPFGEVIVTALLLPTALLVFALYLIEGYGAQTDFLSLDYTSLHLIAVAGVTLATLLVTFVFDLSAYSITESRSVIAFGFALVAPLTLAYRRIWHLRVTGAGRAKPIIFIGDAASAEAFAHDCRQQAMTAEIITCPASPRGTDGHGVVDLETTLDRVEQGDLEPEAIVLREAQRQLPPAASARLMNLYFRGVPVYTLEYFHEIYWRKIPRYRLNEVWLFQEGFQIAREPVFDHLKRVFDIALSATALIAAAPLLLAAAVAIWIEDRGPVLFVQRRIGRDRVPFAMLKLRTMRSTGAGDVYTQRGDARITRTGRFLRSTRIDELPQLWNVLRGDMSLIGPRAEWDRLVAEYETKIPCYHFRHLVRPGITGWAQVNYPYGASIDDTTRKLEYDLYYIRHFSFLLDAAIVLKTVHVMLWGKGR